MKTPVRALFGMETEYAVTATAADGSTLPLDPVMCAIRERAAARPHLPSSDSGVFLANAARLYIDGGRHPEYATPEAVDPWNAVRHALAGDRLMAQIVREVHRDSPGLGSLSLRKGNVDYATAATWASHENYLHACPPLTLGSALVPHLVSRIVLTGAGGLDPFSAERPVFVLSPRALFIRSVVALSVPDALALVDGRDQPHCAGYHRQHLMLGDANHSHLSLFLRIATTALVVALIDAGEDESADVMLRDPLEALQAVARDVALRRTLTTVSGRRVRAVEIQRHYLHRSRRSLDVLPAWAPRVLPLWQDTLDRLERGPIHVADRLDWAIKLAVYRDRGARARRAGLSARSRCRPSSRSGQRPAAWRDELCEIDTRFGNLEPAGLFDLLAGAGVLRHGVAGVDRVEEAITTPPVASRARIRGRVVEELAPRGAGITCDWSEVSDLASCRVLDLSDPFTDGERWRPPPGRPADGLVERVTNVWRNPWRLPMDALRTLAETVALRGAAARLGFTGDHAMTLNNRACDLRARGRTDEAEWLMRAALSVDLDIRPAGHPKIPHRRNNLASVLLIQHRLPEARAELARAWQETGSLYGLTSARILTVRLAAALIGGEPPACFVGQLKTQLAGELRDFANVDRRWRFDTVLRSLEARLAPGSLDLLRAIGEAINGDRAISSLDGLALWHETPATPLDARWPPEPEQDAGTQERT